MAEGYAINLVVRKQMPLYVQISVARADIPVVYSGGSFT